MTKKEVTVEEDLKSIIGTIIYGIAETHDIHHDKVLDILKEILEEIDEAHEFFWV